MAANGIGPSCRSGVAAGETAAARHWLRRAVAVDHRFLKAWAALALTGLGTAGYARATRLRGQWREA